MSAAAAADSADMLEYTPSPTLAAIDRAAERALEQPAGDGDSGAADGASPAQGAGAAMRSAATRSRFRFPGVRWLDRAIGPAKSYERGFIIAAASIAILIVIGRILSLDVRLIALAAPAIVLLATVLQKTDRRVELPTSSQQQSPPRLVALIANHPALRPIATLLAAPMMTRLAAPLFSNADRAALWVSWAALLFGGFLALASVGD